MTYLLTALVTCIVLVVAATTAEAVDDKKDADTKIQGDRSVTKDVRRTPAPPSPLPLPYPTTGTTTTAPTPNAGTGVTGGNSAIVEPAPAASNAKPRDAASGI